MKIRIITVFMLIVVVFLGAISTSAQGIIVHKKDGTSIKVPYTELDIISTYNYDDTPGIGEVEEVKTFDVNGVKFNMIYVEGGSFEMGATAEQSNGYTPLGDEFPVHYVTLSDYYIGQTEVTQSLWMAVMDNQPSWLMGDNLPVHCVSWDDCQEFISKLNEITGLTFRMPTEAEWEYAARGGKKSKGYIFSGSNNVDDVAWCWLDMLFEVGTKAPNELGIHDMSGNVWECCSDWYEYYNIGSQTDPTGPPTGSVRVQRGGSGRDDVNRCRVAFRGNIYPFESSIYRGLRLAL